MKYIFSFVICLITLIVNNLYSQSISLNKNNLEAVHVFMSTEKLMGKEVIKVIKDSTVKDVDEPTFVKINGIDFKTEQ
jgi:hypothetical protein